MNKDIKYVIVDLHDGHKCEGTLVAVDKEKMEIVLNGVRKFKMQNDIIAQESKHDVLIVPKSQIKEVKMIQSEEISGSPKISPNNSQVLKTTSQPETQVPETKTETVNPNAIPKNLEKAKQPKHYEKDNFFDKLDTISNQDSKAETIRYNEKNFETFNITEISSDYRQNNNKRGRGGRNQNNNKNKYGNFYNNNFNDDFGNNDGGNRGGYNNYQRGGGRNYRGNRGIIIFYIF